MPYRITKPGGLLTLLLLSALLPRAGAQTTLPDTVPIRVDLRDEMGPLDPIWAWWGYDEPNYTYMKDGKKLLTEIAQLSKVPVYVRAHSLLVTGEGTYGLKWGSTNAYTEDENGNPVYDWTLVDSIFDTYVERGMKPFAQIGFMPEALSSKPDPYRHYWTPGASYEEIFTGWAYPPNDYEKWAELIYQWVTHCVERYGREEVESWYWEVWNEPNIGYWRGTTEEYIKLYDYSADAVKRALPTARIGGPETTGPGWDEAATFLRTFLDHTLTGTNYATGETGSPLDFITFHAKGNPKVVDGIVQMNMGAQLNDIDQGFEIVASYPELKDLPIIIGESDPEGCAACSEADYPHNAYRNGTMYAAYTAASFARKYDLAREHGVNLLGAVTWGFEFEEQPWYAGFRDMATNGVDKPVLNTFRMFGMMAPTRVAVDQEPLHYDARMIVEGSVREETDDVNALASKGDGSATVLVWNYHDNDELDVPATPVRVELSGFTEDGPALLTHYRIDQAHSNSYTLFKEMGKPQPPSAKQIAALEAAGQLDLYGSPEWVEVRNGRVTVELVLPRQGISLLRWEMN
ncbi:xylan 1,4-beta-xylosidase [Neolewinella xylanilytica]|uniref:Xylan 1,4-beta-xylosidase n=1 Tax=Neolewinella xylanilytica TaxID=1514080 RepID=A0A2S6IAI2_9BACT|nr:beta-xylosidase [Neolewinella xylanilytica]PPK88496.1 xylan 1,4-beta-xylosidase [Neolewinella xylanilytica]